MIGTFIRRTLTILFIPILYTFNLALAWFLVGWEEGLQNVNAVVKWGWTGKY